MFANIGELLASSSLPKPLAAELPAACFCDKQPSAKWTAGWTAELLATELLGERVVAEARAIEAEYAEGREIGRLQEKQSIVRKLKAMGVDPELISQASGMSLEEIDQL